MNKKRELLLPIALMVTLALTRVPGVLPYNFSPVYALVFCAGVYLPKRLALVLPLGVLFLSDVLLDLFFYPQSNFSVLTLIKYLSYAAMICLGQRFGPKRSWLSLLGGGVLGTILFYLITNTASWLGDPGYAKTFAGWLQALTLGLPGFPPTWTFLLKTLTSGGLFTGLFAGVMKMAEQVESETEEETEPSAEDGEAPEAEESKA